jgi:hypothetical protein
METFMEKIYTRQVTLVAFDAIKSIINGEIEKTDGYESEAMESLSRYLSLIANLGVVMNYHTMLYESKRHPEGLQNEMWQDGAIIGLLGCLAAHHSFNTPSWKYGAALWVSKEADLICHGAFRLSHQIPTPDWYQEYVAANTPQEASVTETYGGEA